MQLKSVRASGYIQSIAIGVAVLLGSGVAPLALQAEEVETNIVATYETSFGFVRQLQIGQDNYWVHAYTNVSQAWTFVVPDGVTSLDCLIVAGGGAGGTKNVTSGGGGGAGGLLQGKFPVAAKDVFTFTVGAGGVAGVKGGGGKVGNGFDTVVAKGDDALVRVVGGGAGGNGKSQPGESGGSGGGSGWQATFKAEPYAAAGTAGQGNPGGRRTSETYSARTGATGGGGAGSAGETAASERDAQQGTDGGAGVQSSITGEPLWFAAGGGGGGYNGKIGGAGGSGIGGAGGGASGADANGKAGVDGTGSGGGGSGSGGTASGNGGSGVVIICYKAVAGKTPFVGATVELENSSFVYDGAAKPVVLRQITLLDGTVLTADRLTLGVDYELEPASVGPDTLAMAVMVNGIGDYYGASFADVEITPATPVITGSFEQPDWEWGFDPVAPTGDVTSDFGTVVFRYYADEACSTPMVPSKYFDPGVYYVRPEVEATANWVAVTGEKKSFTVRGTYRPEPKEPVATAFGYTVKMRINGRLYEAAVFTNTDEVATFTVPNGVRSLEYLAVAGGGAGGKFVTTAGAGGGAGGLLADVLQVRSGDELTVTVGKGGVTGVAGGADKVGNGFDTVVAKGDDELVRTVGGGAGGSGKSTWGESGGSGGGSGWQAKITQEPYAQVGTEGQGHAAGSRYYSKTYDKISNGQGGTGGGGAGSVGVALTEETAGVGSATDGGEGVQSSITGELRWYAAGGGGSTAKASPATQGRGGNGIGGNGGQQGTAGLDGTGSGGGGSSKSGNLGGNGGSGIVVFRYPSPDGLLLFIR